ncbi:MAG: TIGR04282 family arsenosugar biosynthesis glycosyltransferase [Xanthobacteraceae bacterium]|jgi:rSAM/selenodomain-associated transferase 1
MDDANRLDSKSKSAERASAGATTADRKACCGIAIMAKASAPGRTKTRLVPPLTFEQAAAFNTAFLLDIAGNLVLAGRYASIAGYAAYAPPGSEDFFRRTLPSAIGLIDACLPNFGDCLLRTIEEIFARGHASAVVLNSDSPTLPTALLVETADALAQPGERVVLGPSSDGGYYLLGLKTAHRRLFEDIAWSTERVAEQTLERARELNLEMHTLPVWYDVDDVVGLRRLHDEVRPPNTARRRLDPSEPHYPAATAELIRSLWAGGELAGGRDRAAAMPAEIGGA